MYEYKKERPKLFTEEGADLLERVRRNVRRCLSASGAFMAERVLVNVSGDSWLQMAALDYLEERGEISKIKTEPAVWGQHQVYVAGRSAEA